jgi:hypothetical protein
MGFVPLIVDSPIKKRKINKTWQDSIVGLMQFPHKEEIVSSNLTPANIIKRGGFYD